VLVPSICITNIYDYFLIKCEIGKVLSMDTNSIYYLIHYYYEKNNFDRNQLNKYKIQNNLHSYIFLYFFKLYTLNTFIIEEKKTPNLYLI